MTDGSGSGGHDQLFKQLLQAFFADFLRLFDPETAARLDLDTMTFVNPEVFTDFPRGERRTADIVVQVQTLDGDAELILVHVEVQREREPDFPWRIMLFNLIFTYLHLNARERDAARIQLRREGDTTVEATELTWADRMLLQGREQGIEQGREQGIEQGLRHAVLRVLVKRFGALPPSISMGLDRIGDSQRLESLLDVALSVSTLEAFTHTLDGN